MLLHEQNRRGERTGTRLNQALLKHTGDLCFNFFLLEIRVPIGSHVDWCGLRQQMYMVVGVLGQRHCMEGTKQRTELDE